MLMRTNVIRMKKLLCMQLKMVILIVYDKIVCSRNGCPWNEDTTFFAAANGHLDCLR